mgnify:CR=1 FL=1
MAIVHDVIPPFSLFQPASIDDALELLAARGEEAWVLAGGMDSMDWLKDRTKRTSAVIASFVIWMCLSLSPWLVICLGIRNRFPISIFSISV